MMLALGFAVGMLFGAALMFTATLWGLSVGMRHVLHLGSQNSGSV